MAFVLDISRRYEKIRFSEEPDKLEVIEIRPSHSSYEFQRTQIPDVNVGLWSTKSSLDETEAPAMLRLVCVRMPRPYECDARKSSLDILLENFKLEEAYRYSFTQPAVHGLMPVRQTEQSDMPTFSLCTPSQFGIAWKYDSRSGTIEGLIWADDWRYETMWRTITMTKQWAQHPLFLALVASDMLAVSLADCLATENAKLNAVEARTRYHGFTSMLARTAEGDYPSLSQKMGGCAGMLALAERGYKVFNEILGDITFFSQPYNVTDDPSSRKSRSEVEDYVETLKRRSKMQKIELDFLSQRVEIQLTAVRDAPFITQMSILHPNGPC